MNPLVMDAEENRDNEQDPEIEAMIEAGVHLGHVRSKRHPGMMPFLWGVRNDVEIIDLTKTREKLLEAKEFLRMLGREKKLILFVGTRPGTKMFVRAAAESLGFPYVHERWIGGTLTNFKVILKRIETLEALEQEQATGGFEKYTKKERMLKEKEMENLRENFDGLRRLRKIPDAMVIVDISHDTLALQEAKKLGIPVVALTDTNTDPRLVQYPIPSNDDARPAVAYMLKEIEQAVREGQDAIPPVADEAGSAEEKKLV